MHHATLARLANLAYSSDRPAVIAALDGLGFDRVVFFDKDGTQAVLAGNGSEMVLAFRGTELDKIKDVLADLDVRKASFRYGKVHEGFLHALKPVEGDIADAVARMYADGSEIYVTGHSLGAALATLMVASGAFPVRELVTFGSPRVGNKEFAVEFERLYLNRSTRYVNNNDIVARVPSPIRFEHIGRLVYFNRHGVACGDVGYWKGLGDRVRGRFASLFKLDPVDGVTDHSMDEYERLMPRV